AAQAGRSAFLIGRAGGGKTLAGFWPSLVELGALSLPPRAGRGRHTEGVAGEGASRFLPDGPAPSPGSNLRFSPPSPRARGEGYGLHTLYISPLKALAVDVARNLEIPVAEMNLPIRLETRTGDTPASKRQRQRRHPPHILMTTPEQLALILASPDAPYLFGSLRRVVLDELHALVT